MIEIEQTGQERERRVRKGRATESRRAPERGREEEIWSAGQARKVEKRNRNMSSLFGFLHGSLSQNTQHHVCATLLASVDVIAAALTVAPLLGDPCSAGSPRLCHAVRF